MKVKFGFQTQMEGLVELHDNIMYYLVVILFAVGWVLLSIVRNYIATKSPIVEWLGRSLLWVKTLSNSGELLKLLIPSNFWKDICGWSNYSGMVISQKIALCWDSFLFKNKTRKLPVGWMNKILYGENQMDYRGSKSVVATLLAATVKEQRVDGNGQVKFLTCLRCILTGLERDSYINIQSKQINKRFISSIGTHRIKERDLGIKMNPYFFTGFSDGEASFILYVQKYKYTKIGWACWLTFEINLSSKDLSILKDIKDYLGVGKINQKSNGTCVYYIKSFKELDVLIDHFDKYPLLTQKLGDFLLFKLAYEVIKGKKHLTPEGLQEILAIKASMNKGLPLALKAVFPNITPITRPLVLNSKVRDPNWLAGFTTAVSQKGCGCFMVKVQETPGKNTRVLLRFKLTQHPKDEQLMRSLVDYLGCGHIYVDERSVDYIVAGFKDITVKIIPLFAEYPIQGIKYLNYLDFVKVGQIMKNKLHLTDKGVKLARKIKSGMNIGRT